MNPKVSLVMPTYNRGDSYLKTAIQSVLDQSYSDFELVIIDDASTDNTKDIVLSCNDKRIMYHQTDHNHGEYWSTNFAMSLSKGQYVTWIHSDDMMPKESLMLLVKELDANHGIDFVHGDIEKVDETGTVIESLISTDDNSPNVFNQYVTALQEGKMVYLVHHTTIMMKRSFFYKAGPFDSSLPFGGDIDWMVRALRIGSFKRIPQVLYLYRKHALTRRVVDVKDGVDKVAVHKNIAARYI